MDKDMGAISGSRASHGAAKASPPAGFDPARDLPSPCYDKELRLFTQATSDLWRAIQEDELCDLTECTFKFGGNCHCMGTFLALGMDALAIATGPQDIAQETVPGSDMGKGE